eukprot:TRINITY_DN39720_c0_g1_i1.p1 TRINITY_DN39720_c0_g1~~TRINITY_DN39720_c0_g1_i1.p1  ORF type:complete len:544 (-),score=132.02 TRINITY_DN39720_c0_g1_i1:17-1648(-)
MELALRIQDLSGLVCSIVARASWTADDVKDAVAEAAGIPSAEQRLILLGAEGTELQGSRPLGSFRALADARADGYLVGGDSSSTSRFRESGFSSDRADEEWEILLARRSPEQMEWLRLVQTGDVQLSSAPLAILGDAEVMLAAIDPSSGSAMQHASESLRNDREFVLRAVAKNGDALQFAAQEFWSDRAVLLSAVRTSASALALAPTSLQADREVVMAAVRAYRDGADALSWASPALRADREVVRQALRCSGKALRFVSDSLRADRELVLLAISKSSQAFQYAAEELRGDRAFVLEAVRSGLGCEALSFASAEVRGDASVVREAMRSSYSVAFAYAAPALLADRGFVLDAVQRSGLLLSYADPQLRADREVVLSAVRNHGEALRFASTELKADRSIVLEAVRCNSEALRFAAEAFQADVEVVLASIEQSDDALQHADQALLDDHDFVIAAVRQVGIHVMTYTKPALRGNAEFFLKALGEGITAFLLLHADPGLLVAEDFLRAAVRLNADVWDYVSVDIVLQPFSELLLFDELSAPLTARRARS